MHVFPSLFSTHTQLQKNRNEKGKLLPKKLRGLQMKGTNKTKRAHRNSTDTFQH